MEPSILKLMVNDGPGTMYAPDFRQMIEDHLVYLRGHAQTEVIDISNVNAHAHHGDLYGLLTEYDVQQQFHWIIMRVNGYHSPMEYDESHVTLLVPSLTVIESLLRVHRAVKRPAA